MAIAISSPSLLDISDRGLRQVKVPKRLWTLIVVGTWDMSGI